MQAVFSDTLIGDSFCSNNMPLSVGDVAPDFKAKADDGTEISLSELLSKGNVVLYFYPKDETSGCTAEACEFRDRWSEIEHLGATVVGVSSDSVESHVKFKNHHNLQFTLVADEGSRIRKLYKATGLLIPPRITYVIDRAGKIRHVYNSQLSPREHVSQAIMALKKLNSGN